MIHEVGHEFGLMHPHGFGYIGDFVYSAMGYFTNDYNFGQIDRDAIQRAHIDQVYFETQGIMRQLPNDAASQVQAKLVTVDASYAAMNYVDAMRAVLSAHQLAQQLLGSATMGVTQTESSPAITSATSSTTEESNTLYIIAGIAVGLAAGVSIVMLAKKRKPERDSRVAESKIRPA